MRRKPAAYLYTSFTLPLVFIIPILLTLYTLNKLSLFFLLSYLALPITLIYCVVPSGKKTITGGNGSSPTLLNWIAKLWLIELSALFLFLGTARTFGDYLTANNLIQSTSTTSWLNTFTHFIFLNWGLFPSAILALAVAVFIKSAQKHPGDPHHLTRELSSSKKLHGWLIRRTGDYYLMLIARIFQAFILAAAVISLSHYLYPTYCNFHHPLPGMVTATLLLVILTLKKTEKLYLTIKERKTAPYKHLLALLVLVTGISILLSAVVHHFILPREAQWYSRWTTLKLLPDASTQTLVRLFSFAWWMAALPLLSSLVCFYSQGKSIRLTLIALIIPTLLLAAATYFWPDWTTLLTKQAGSLIFFGYLISLILLFFSLRKASSNQITWFGYLPNRPMKKLRVTNPRLVWLLVPIWLGMISITGIDGVLITGIVAAIPLLLFYFYLSLKNFL